MPPASCIRSWDPRDSHPRDSHPCSTAPPRPRGGLRASPPPPWAGGAKSCSRKRSRCASGASIPRRGREGHRRPRPRSSRGGAGRGARGRLRRRSRPGERRGGQPVRGRDTGGDSSHRRGHAASGDRPLESQSSDTPCRPRLGLSRYAVSRGQRRIRAPRRADGDEPSSPEVAPASDSACVAEDARDLHMRGG